LRRRYFSKNMLEDKESVELQKTERRSRRRVRRFPVELTRYHWLPTSVRGGDTRSHEVDECAEIGRGWLGGLFAGIPSGGPGDALARARAWIDGSWTLKGVLRHAFRDMIDSCATLIRTWESRENTNTYQSIHQFISSIALLAKTKKKFNSLHLLNLENWKIWYFFGDTRRGVFLNLANATRGWSYRRDYVARHRALFIVNLSCHGRALSCIFVGGPRYQRSQSFICVGGYTQRTRPSVALLHCTRILPVHAARARALARSLAERDRAHHDVTSRFYIAAYVVLLHNNSAAIRSLPSRSVDYRYTIDRRRQPSPPRSPRDRSSGRILWISPPFILSLVNAGSRFRSRRPVTYST